MILNNKTNKQLITKISILAVILSPLSIQAVEFSLFGDVTATTSNKDDENSNFALGALDLFAAHQINEDTFALMELVFENNGDGFVVDLERLWIRHNFSDQFQLAAGRFHSPIGYWNRYLHHGAILQDTVERPFFLDFEDGNAGILPVHSIGIMANGFILADSEALKYEVIISNGPSLDSSGGLNPIEKPELDPNNISDNNENKSFATRFTYGPEDSNWSLGIFTMNHNIGESSDYGLTPKGETLVKQAIYGADFFYQGERFDLLAEVFSLTNDDLILNNGKFNSLAYYIQPSYRLSDKIKLIYRYADLTFDEDDTYYQLLSADEQATNTATIRYDLDGYNTLKLEFSHVTSSVVLLNNSNEIHLQWSFLLQ